MPLRAWKPRPGCRRFPVSPATAGCGSSIGNRSALSTAGLVVDSTQLVVRQIEAVGTETLVGLVPARVKEGSKTPLNPQGWCMEEAEKRDASSSRCLHAGALGQSKELTTSTGSSGHLRMSRTSEKPSFARIKLVKRHCCPVREQGGHMDLGERRFASKKSSSQLKLSAEGSAALQTYREFPLFAHCFQLAAKSSTYIQTYIHTYIHIYIIYTYIHHIYIYEPDTCRVYLASLIYIQYKIPS